MSEHEQEFQGFDRTEEVEVLWEDVEALHQRCAELDVPLLVVAVPRVMKDPDDGQWVSSVQCATYLKSPPHAPSSLYAAFEMVKSNNDAVAMLALKLLKSMPHDDDE